MSLRKKAVDEGRAFVRVRIKRTGDLATVGVCPACWNMPERRPAIQAMLSRLGLQTVHKEDSVQGTYRAFARHAPGCRYGRLTADPWERLRRAIKKEVGDR